jgi:hypothetical protein
VHRSGPWRGHEPVLSRMDAPLRAMSVISMFFFHGETRISLFLVKRFLKKNHAVLCPGIDAILCSPMLPRASCCIERPPLRQPCPLWGRGHMRFICMTVYLIPGYTTPSQPGRHSGWAKPRERPAFLVTEHEHVFDFEFWNTMLITFFSIFPLRVGG